MTQHNPTNGLKLDILTLKPGLPSGQALKTKVLVRVVAPEQTDSPINQEQTQRAPIDLAVVIDRSGSMTGEPLDAAIGCAEKLIQSLRSDDRVAIVTFDSEVNVVQPLIALTEREVLCAKLRQIQAGGNTALFAGWQEGARQIAPFTTANRISRVILLTDGQANNGLTDPEAIAEKVAELARAGVTTSTVGLGGKFNETLLTKIADAGEGQAHYGQTPEDLEDGFAEEFQILNRARLRKLTLRVSGGRGVVANILRRDGSRGDSAKLGTLPHGAALDAIVQLEIGAERHAGGLLSATVDALDVAGNPVTLGPVVLSLPELNSAELEALPGNPAIAAAISESDFADEFLRIHELAQNGRVAEALAAIRALRNRPGSTEWAKRTARYIIDLADDDLESAIKEISYSGRSFRSRTREASLNEAYSIDYMLDAETAKPEVYLSKKLGSGRSRKRSGREEKPGAGI
ncbi:MAG: vWA domain-containing protein [Opitutales bacterium]